MHGAQFAPPIHVCSEIKRRTSTPASSSMTFDVGNVEHTRCNGKNLLPCGVFVASLVSLVTAGILKILSIRDWPHVPCCCSLPHTFCMLCVPLLLVVTCCHFHDKSRDVTELDCGVGFVSRSFMPHCICLLSPQMWIPKPRISTTV